jgi:hypothetical protein
MEETKSFEGAALATTFLMNGLITMLVARGLLEPGDREWLFDTTLITLEEGQVNDEPENALRWQDARRHVAILQAAHRSDAA